MKMQDNNLNLLTSRIIEAAISVHTELGPGLLESVYSAAMVVELDLMGIDAKSEISVSVYYRGNKISDEGFRMDLLVEDTIIVELKSVDSTLKGLWAFSVDYDTRVIFSFLKDDEVLPIDIGSHDEVY